MALFELHDCQSMSLTSSPSLMVMDLPSPGPSVASQKRKRGLDSDDAGTLRILSSPYGQMPLPTPAPSFSSSFHDLSTAGESAPQLANPMQRNASFDSRQSKRLHISPRPRMSRQLSQPSSELSGFVALASPTSTTAACHICQRRPSTRQDLPGYVDCETCGSRTCFICIRTCEGVSCQNPAGRRSYGLGLGLGADGIPAGRRVCGKCCVEVGAEGRIWCLTCYDDGSEDPFLVKHSKQELETESAGRIADWLTRASGDEVFEPHQPEGYFYGQ